MNGFLLDTHALIWWNTNDPKLGSAARSIIEDPDSTVFASAVNAFEITIKHRLGKLPMVETLLADYESVLAETGFAELPISTRHALRAGTLPFDHPDPFDRLLIAQALVEGLTLLSNEQRFDATGVPRVWS